MHALRERRHLWWEILAMSFLILMFEGAKKDVAHSVERTYCTRTRQGQPRPQFNNTQTITPLEYLAHKLNVTSSSSSVSLAEWSRTTTKTTRFGIADICQKTRSRLWSRDEDFNTMYVYPRLCSRDDAGDDDDTHTSTLCDCPDFDSNSSPHIYHPRRRQRLSTH